MSGSGGPLARIPSLAPGRKLVLVVWLFVGIVICVLAIVMYGVSLLSSARAYVAAEGHWSKAQKDAIFHLKRYATDHREEDWRAFEREMAVPLGMRRARAEFLKPKPDLEVVRQGLLAGRNHSEDVEGMVELYHRLGGLAAMQEAIALWKRSDPHIDQLLEIGRRLREGGRLGPAQTRKILADIDAVHARISPHQDEFGARVSGLQRSAKQALVVGTLLVAGVLMLVAIALSRRLLAQSERAQKTLSENESQLRTLIESAPLPLIIVRRSDAQLLHANDRALQQFGLTEAQARGRSLGDFHADPADRDAMMEALDRAGTVRDQEVEMQDRNGRRFWLLLSMQPIRYGGEACLLAALHNIDDRKRMQDDMRFRAMHDGLTNLPNRAMFMESLDRALKKSRRRHARFSVLFIDLDRFKVVNDTLGHHAGDELLQAVAERLRAAVRDSDLVARLGGDEFVVLIEDHGGPEEVMIVAQKVLQMLDRPVVIEWREVNISCSIGISSFPDDGEDLATLVKNADIAMYQAKERGRNNFQFYSPELNKLTIQRFELETRLRGALDRGEFFLQYQPEVDLEDGRILGVEALLRWRDPQTGLVMPGEFIPLAEETGTIIPIGRWVVDQALADLKRWHDQGIDIYVSVNISARQFQHHELVNEIFQALQASKVAPRYLRLEITETMMMHDPPTAERALRALKGLGVELAVDDFGTGFSSLSLVRRFPIHVVKIDRSFVGGCPQNRECVAIVQAVSAMAYTLGLRVVAEGVETPEQREMVASFGCDAAQGFFFASPMDADQVAGKFRSMAQPPRPEGPRSTLH